MINFLFILGILLKINFIYMDLSSINEYKNEIIQKSNNSKITVHYHSNLKKKNLIIGVITNYKWEIIAPFIESYAKSGFENCDCIIFAHNITQNTINKIKSFGIIVYDIPDKFRYKKIINFRWKIYEDYLNSNINKYNIVFSADLRDVFFQKDLFQYYNGNKSFLGVALEEDNLTELINKKWLIDAYGEDLYKTIENQRIICVGTIWGTINKFIEFSKIMWEQLDSEWSLRLNVIDQAVGNYIIYHYKMFSDCLIKSENKDGPIMTVGLLPKNKIYFDLDDNIVNGEGKVAAVIHQYDRIPQIVRKVMNKYCSKKNNTTSNYYCIIIYFLIVIIFVLIKVIIFFLYKANIKKKPIVNAYEQTIFNK